jgi:hypothetical protein
MLVLVNSQQGAAVEDPYQVPESGGGAFVDDRFGVEKPAIPGTADSHVADGQGDVVECRKSHDYVPFWPVRAGRLAGRPSKV